MDEKGIIFTTDALLALLIITMVIGISINQYDALIINDKISLDDKAWKKQ